MIVKKIILILGLILFKISFGQTLDGKVVYNASLFTDLYVKELKNNNELPEYRKRLKIQETYNAKPMNFILLFKGNESLYHSEFDLNMQRDMGMGMNLVGMVAGDDYTSYTNLKTNEIRLQKLTSQPQG